METMSEEVKQTTARGRGRGRRQNAGEDGAAAGNDPYARPKTAARSGRRGENKEEEEKKAGVSRGRGERRPQTARQAANAAETGEDGKGPGEGGRGGRGGRGRGRGGGEVGDRPRNNNRDQDKNSWVYKFHHMERKEYQKITFTEDTVIPELPAKKDLLKEPAKNEFDRDMAQQDQLI